jgi:signal transduction histidine kinase
MSATNRRETVRTALAWCRAVAYPLVLLAVLALRLSPVATLLLIGAALFLPIALLRRRPWPALLLMLAGLASATAAFENPMDTWYAADVRILQLLGIDLAVGFIAARRPRRTSIAAALIALLVQLLVSGLFPRQAFDSVAVILVLSMVTVWVVGQSLRQRRQYADARRVQAEHEAVQAERLRIARELHDMIAHSIGVIAIQAGVGRRVIETQPAEARNALAAIEDTSRETLAGLRRILGTLRQADPEPGGAPTAPAPGLADLDRLVARTADAGVKVDVEWRGDHRPLPPDIDLSAFRIVQEAVTNVVRHAGTPRCCVVLDRRDDELSIEVTDDGPGGATGAGYGIPGMRERVNLLHGEFSAGTRAEGGFRVAARIPVR